MGTVLTRRSLIMITLFAMATPLSFWAVNAPRGASPKGPALVGVAAIGVGLLAVMALRVRVPPDRSVAIVSVLLLAAFNWRLLGDPLRELTEVIPRDLAPFPLVALLVYLAARFGARYEAQVSLLIMGTIMVGASFVSLAVWYLGDAASPPASSFEPTPWPATEGDVHVIVVDGYGREDVLDVLYGFDNSEFIAALQQAGFVVPADAHSNYTSTIASMSSALLGDHLDLVGSRLTDRERLAVHSVLGGENPIVNAFRQSGYRYLHIEGGWIAGSCGSAVDECVSATLFDEALWALAERSAFGWWFERSRGHAFSSNALRALDDLTALEKAPSDGGRFIFTHIILPHPPLLIDRECSVRFAQELTGDAVGHPTYSAELISTRRRAYVEQIECVNSRILDFLEFVEVEDTVILFGDHGPDSFGQLALDPSQWEADHVWERLAVFAAIRMPGCMDSVPEYWSPVNGLRSMIGCVSGDPVDDVEDRLFIFPIDASPGVVTEVDYGFAASR